MVDFLMNTLLPLLNACLEPLIVLVITLAAYYIKKSFGITIDAELQKKWRNLAVDAIYTVEERHAREMAERGATNLKGRKHGAAVDKLLELAPDIDKATASRLVEGIVSRLPDVGSFTR